MKAAFVNREAEMKLINEAFKALQNYDEHLLRIPVLDFFGVEGIGKTAMLKHIERQCENQNLYCIWVDASHDTQHFSQEIISEVKKYNVPLTLESEDKDLFQQSLNATKALMKQGAVVMLLDAVDASDEELVKQIGAMLRDVIEENKLFVVLSSKRGLLFENERSVARKLATVQLKAFDRQSCNAYLNNIQADLEPKVRDHIFDWTRGYPLAMQVMVQAIADHHLNPEQAEDQKKILDQIVERVIMKGVLAQVKKPTERAEYQAVLTLLSMPRRFNLVIMQELIERYEPKLKRDSIIAYMSLPRNINQATDIMNWNLLRAGFAVEAPVRNIFLLKCRIEQPERYIAIHRFLAQMNRTLAGDVPAGSDRIRYLREYFYHSAHVESSQDFEKLLEQTVQQIIAEPIEFFQQFYEEILQDEELKEALGLHFNTVLSLIYRHLAQIHRYSARGSSEENRLHDLREFFYYLINDPKAPDHSALLAQNIEEILAEEPPDRRAYFARELLGNNEFQKSLGSNFELLSSLFQEYFSLEG